MLMSLLLSTQFTQSRDLVRPQTHTLTLHVTSVISYSKDCGEESLYFIHISDVLLTITPANQGLSL